MRVAATDLLVPAALAGVVATAWTVATGPPVAADAGVIAAGYIALGPMAAGYGLWTLAMSGGAAERLTPLGYATPLGMHPTGGAGGEARCSGSGTGFRPVVHEPNAVSRSPAIAWRRNRASGTVSPSRDHVLLV